MGLVAAMGLAVAMNRAAHQAADPAAAGAPGAAMVDCQGRIGDQVAVGVHPRRASCHAAAGFVRQEILLALSQVYAADSATDSGDSVAAGPDPGDAAA